MLRDGVNRLSAAVAGMRSGLAGRLSATSGHLVGPGGVVTRLGGADRWSTAAVRGAVTAQSRGDAVTEATNPKTGLGFGAGIAASFFIVGAVASQTGGDGDGSDGGGSGSGDQRDSDNGAPADRRDEEQDRAAPSGPKTPLEGPLDTGLPGGFDRAMDPNGDYVPGDPTAEYTIRQLLDNGWRIRFTDPGTINGDTYMDFDRVDENGLHTMWLSTELMNLPPDKLMAAIAEGIQ
ncbi:hypothetical protein AB0H42_10665 [Nocardia sp. NPDC050799]|uniref:hypothetical protein n=1 Tax=Nocardia sp. NPDC050799 TaxID=3154842 RepID=UPI003405DAEA